MTFNKYTSLKQQHSGIVGSIVVSQHQDVWSFISSLCFCVGFLWILQCPPTFLKMLVDVFGYAKLPIG